MSTDDERRKVAQRDILSFPKDALGFWWSTDDVATILCVPEIYIPALHAYSKSDFDWALTKSKAIKQCTFISYSRVRLEEKGGDDTYYYYFHKHGEDRPTPASMRSEMERDVELAKENRPNANSESLARLGRAASRAARSEPYLHESPRLMRPRLEGHKGGESRREAMDLSSSSHASEHARVQCHGVDRQRYKRWSENSK